MHRVRGRFSATVAAACFAALLVAVPSAQAAVTTSNVTSPKDAAYLLYNENAPKQALPSRRAIKRANFAVGKKVPAGRVVSERPKAHNHVDYGTKVGLNVSDGNEGGP